MPGLNAALPEVQTGTHLEMVNRHQAAPVLWRADDGIRTRALRVHSALLCR